MANLINLVVEEFRVFSQIRAIALSGSTTTNYGDELSDYDIYIYTDTPVDTQKRAQVAAKFTPDAQINNQYWETGDEWEMPDARGIDIMYRDPKWIEEQIERVWHRHCASLGYSTCFLYNVANSQILFDCNNWFFGLKSALDAPYPKELKYNIIEKNLPLLMDKPSASYFSQIENALRREDFVSVNHRIAAFLASYFDIIFALNELLHPGEKRLLRYVKENCKLVPENFDSDIKNITTQPLCNTFYVLESLVNSLKKIL